MAKKAAIGMSVETLVVIIISLVVLAGGMTLLYKFIGGAEDTKALLDSKTDDELERLLADQGKQVALPRNIATIERGNSHVFGVGILNVDSAGTGDSFTIDVNPNQAVDESGNILDINSEEISSNWLLWNNGAITIVEGDHSKESILIKIPDEALKGEYIFDVLVYDAQGDKYGNKQKIVVKVK
ncbi:MAG: hypothetical protein AABY26_00430 [Nanoarchaeota archaeon]